MLVYEYMENNNLALALFGPEETRLKLDWQRRRKICIGVANANALKVEGRLLELVDPNLGSDYSKEEAEELLNLALACTDESPNPRPTMSEVVSKLDVQIGMPSIIIHGSKENEHQELEIVQEISNSNQAPVSSSDEPSGSHATNFSSSNAFDPSAYKDLQISK